jgi:hypothetical protein
MESSIGSGSTRGLRCSNAVPCFDTPWTAQSGPGTTHDPAGGRRDAPGSRPLSADNKASARALWRGSIVSAELESQVRSAHWRRRAHAVALFVCRSQEHRGGAVPFPETMREDLSNIFKRIRYNASPDPPVDRG